jgi:hypothetical protein
VGGRADAVARALGVSRRRGETDDDDGAGAPKTSGGEAFLGDDAFALLLRLDEEPWTSLASPAVAARVAASTSGTTNSRATLATSVVTIRPASTRRASTLRLHAAGPRSRPILRRMAAARHRTRVVGRMDE